MIHLRLLRAVARSSTRHIHTAPVNFSARQSPLFELRQKTGLAYNLCREALNKHQNDVVQAQAWLEAQALTHGLQKAAKVRDRSSKEGLVGLAIHEGNKLISILELNCETDFVAKNQLFRDFACDLTHQFSSLTQDCVQHSSKMTELVHELNLNEENYKIINTQVPPLITRLGENIKISRALHLRASDNELKLYSSVHAKAVEKEVNNVKIVLGRYGSVVGIRPLDNVLDSKMMASIGARLCQHVIGYNPTYIELPEQLRQHLDAAHQEKLESDARLKADPGDKNNSQEIEDSDNEADNSDKVEREWPSIMDQTLIMSDTETVREFCSDRNIQIVYFNRFEAGHAN